ncbi:MAG: PepSY domain-containing protein [Gemmatimonadota bacterium]
MIGTRGKARVAWWHRWLGLILTLPLLGWIVSSTAMMLVIMNAPNGLAGNYRLNPVNSVDVSLQSAVITPSAVLKRISAEQGLERVYSLRLQSRGPHLWYVVKPTPSALAIVFDARTGKRLDPLSDELLAAVASEALVGTRFASLEPVTEYNRYYDVDRVQAVRARLQGEQPAMLILSRDEGRTLRRLNDEAASFNWWYRIFHVNQLSDHIVLWTIVLFTSATGVILVSSFGYLLFFWRRNRVIDSSRSRQYTNRSLHRKFGVAVGGLLIVELAAGIYMWVGFGPREDRFRGKESINPEWTSGISTSATLADPQTVLQTVAGHLATSPRPVQAIEWRRLYDRDGWVVTQRLDELGKVFDATTGEPIEALPVDVAGLIAQQEVIGRPTFFYVGEGSQLWMDLNRPVPAYRFRFDDPGKSDVYIAKASGQVLQRRPAFWRNTIIPLDLHMFSITGKPWLDMSILMAFQAGIVGSIITGWLLQFPLKRGNVSAGKDETEPGDLTESDLNLETAQG